MSWNNFLIGLIKCDKIWNWFTALYVAVHFWGRSQTLDSDTLILGSVLPNLLVSPFQKWTITLDFLGENLFMSDIKKKVLTQDHW